MSRDERLHRMMMRLRERGGFERDAMIGELEVSHPTFKRDLEYLRSRLGADIEYDPSEKVYRLATAGPIKGLAVTGKAIELTGLWFSAEEMLAILSMYRLLDGVGANSLVGPHLAPFKERIEALLSQGASPAKSDAEQIQQRVKILSMARRTVVPDIFKVVATGVLHRRRIQIAYRSRASNESTSREVSPQRIVHYRDNWYLDAYCHLRERISTFSVDAISKAKLLKVPAVDIDERELGDTLEAGYGIFSGRPVNSATLLFSESVSRWVSAEAWHPQQKGRWVGPQWEVSFPYADSRELKMDILKYGPDVSVKGPEDLKNEIRELRRRAAMID
jgi:predicted DNA-binding transcriptional regulator YafY